MQDRSRLQGCAVICFHTDNANRGCPPWRGFHVCWEGLLYILMTTIDIACPRGQRSGFGKYRVNVSSTISSNDTPPPKCHRHSNTVLPQAPMYLRGAGAGRAYSLVACRNPFSAATAFLGTSYLEIVLDIFWRSRRADCLTLDRASFSRQSAVPTPDGDTSNIWALVTHLPYFS